MKDMAITMQLQARRAIIIEIVGFHRDEAIFCYAILQVIPKGISVMAIYALGNMPGCHAELARLKSTYRTPRQGRAMRHGAQRAVGGSSDGGDFRCVWRNDEQPEFIQCWQAMELDYETICPEYLVHRS